MSPEGGIQGTLGGTYSVATLTTRTVREYVHCTTYLQFITKT